MTKPASCSDNAAWDCGTKRSLRKTRGSDMKELYATRERFILTKQPRFLMAGSRLFTSEAAMRPVCIPLLLAVWLATDAGLGRCLAQSEPSTSSEPAAAPLGPWLRDIERPGADAEFLQI